MDSKIKGTIINASYQGWYARGSKRLERSLIYHGWNYDINIWNDEQISQMEYFNPDFPYTVKAAAICQAIKMGYSRIIWMDCSLWAVRNPNILMDMLNHNGGLFIRSGFNLAQTASDNDLKFAGFDRNHAEKLDELWSCIFGINLEIPKSKKFVELFLNAAQFGVFNTPRHNDGYQSTDKRFLFPRQDQTAASIAYHLAGFENVIEPWDILFQPDDIKTAPEHAIIHMRGM